MDKDTIQNYNHSITIVERKSILVTGVKKIESFDDEEFLMETTLGFLVIKGSELEIIKLDTYQGNVSIKAQMEFSAKQLAFSQDLASMVKEVRDAQWSQVKPKNLNEAKKILINYKNMIEGKEYDEGLLGELNVYDNINKQPNRIKCALLPETAIDKMLGGLENE